MNSSRTFISISLSTLHDKAFEPKRLSKLISFPNRRRGWNRKNLAQPKNVRGLIRSELRVFALSSVPSTPLKRLTVKHNKNWKFLVRDIQIWQKSSPYAGWNFAMVNRDALSTVFCVTWLILLPPRVTWRISGDFGFQVRHIFSPAERRLQRRVDGKPERMCHTTQIHFIWISFRASDVSPKRGRIPG